MNCVEPEQREADPKWQMFKNILTQSMTEDLDNYERKERISFEELRKEKTSKETAFLKQKAARHFMSFINSNSLTWTNIHPDALIQISHTMSESDLTTMNIHLSRFQNSVTRPVSTEC